MLLAPSDFFAGLRKGLKAQLPPEMRQFHSNRGRGRLMKVHFGEPAYHFEVWHHTGAGRLEVGLHFEASAAENQAAFDFFRARIVEVKGGLPRAATKRSISRPSTSSRCSRCWDNSWRGSDENCRSHRRAAGIPRRAGTTS